MSDTLHAEAPVKAAAMPAPASTPLGDTPRVTTTNSPKVANPRRRGILIKTVAAMIVAVTGTGVGYVLLDGSAGDSSQALLYHEVATQDFEITVIERGNLESQNEEKVLCEVDDFRRDGINGNPIVWVIPNGSEVKQGDLVVELDSAPLKEELDEQELDCEQATELFLLAEAAHENQLTQNDTNKAEAELKVKLAQMELDMFVDSQNGTHKLEVEEIERQIDDVNNEILAAQANLELKRNDKRGIETLFKLGYAGKSELDRARLEFLQAESAYAAKVNRLKTQRATLTKKQTYERDMQLLKLEGALSTSQRNLKQVTRNNAASLAKAKASLESKREYLAKEQERLQRLQDQYAKCKIHAPQNGMVAYASSRNEVVRAGAPVRMRQHILSIPNLTKMQVKTAVHESVLDSIRPGLKTTIRVDAFSNRTYTGTVHSVAVLPDQDGWVGSDTKIYDTVILIDSDVENLKPGMTAVVEIHVDKKEDVVVVPIQAVLEEDDQAFCYVDRSGRLERRIIKVGKSNDQMIHVTDGLRADERVVLNPMTIASGEQDFADMFEATTE